MEGFRRDGQLKSAGKYATHHYYEQINLTKTPFSRKNYSGLGVILSIYKQFRSNKSREKIIKDATDF